MMRNFFPILALVVATTLFAPSPRPRSSSCGPNLQSTNRESAGPYEVGWNLHTLPKPSFIKTYRNCTANGPSLSVFSPMMVLVTSLANPNNTTKDAFKDAAIALAGSYAARYLFVTADKTLKKHIRSAEAVRILGLTIFIISQNARDLYNLCSEQEDEVPKGLTETQYQLLKIALGITRTCVVLVPPYVIGLFPDNMIRPKRLDD